MLNKDTMGQIAAVMLQHGTKEQQNEALKYCSHSGEALSEWQKTKRTHEECCDCELKYVMPPLCNGHVSGPNHCGDFVKESMHSNWKSTIND